MNNNYFDFNPNLMRNMPYTNVIGTGARMAPRTGILSSLLGGTRGIGTATGASRITFSSILNGTSKTLGVINQAIPVFYQVKPIWNNAKTMFRVAKEINSSNKTTTNQKKEVITNNNETKKENSNSPTFFL